ncbi:MAG: hypothetical protein HOI53_03565 [Francisellaceae bacterium]|nr:hypothetical protein [Francisellaceae bacterium]
MTLAIRAAQFNAHNVMAVLHEKGVNLSEAIQVSPDNKTTPALVAAQFHAHNVMEVLHKKGVDLSEAIQAWPNQKTTPALVAARNNAHNVMAVLCKKGVNLSEAIQLSPDNKTTPALVAARFNAHNVMAKLDAYGVNIYSCTESKIGDPNNALSTWLVAGLGTSQNKEQQKFSPPQEKLLQVFYSWTTWLWGPGLVVFHRLKFKKLTKIHFLPVLEKKWLS